MRESIWRYKDGTGSQAVAFNHPAAITAVACAFLIGTGGAMTPAYFKQRQEKGYKYAQVEYGARAHSVRPLREPKDNLAHVRSVLKPSISELAVLFGVTRQTVYNWMSGERPSPESAEKLDDLARAADVFLAEGMSTSSYLLKRKLHNGKSIVDVVREGGSAQDAARTMIQFTQKEIAQREALQRRLANRTRPNWDQSEFGIPMLDEESWPLA